MNNLATRIRNNEVFNFFEDPEVKAFISERLTHYPVDEAQEQATDDALEHAFFGMSNHLEEEPDFEMFKIHNYKHVFAHAHEYFPEKTGEFLTRLSSHVVIADDIESNFSDYKELYSGIPRTIENEPEYSGDLCKFHLAVMLLDNFTHRKYEDSFYLQIANWGLEEMDKAGILHSINSENWTASSLCVFQASPETYDSFLESIKHYKIKFSELSYEIADGLDLLPILNKHYPQGPAFTTLLTYYIDEFVQSGVFTTYDISQFLKEMGEVFQCELLAKDGNAVAIDERLESPLIVGNLEHTKDNIEEIFNNCFNTFVKEEKRDICQMFVFEGSHKVLHRDFSSCHDFFV